MDPSQRIQASSGVKPPWSFRFFWPILGPLHSKWNAKPDQLTMNLGVMNLFDVIIWWYRKSNFPLFPTFSFHLFSPPTWRDFWTPSPSTQVIVTTVVVDPRLSLSHISREFLHIRACSIFHHGLPEPPVKVTRWWPAGSWCHLWPCIICVVHNMLMEVLVFFLDESGWVFISWTCFFPGFFVSKNNIFRYRSCF